MRNKTTLENLITIANLFPTNQLIPNFRRDLEQRRFINEREAEQLWNDLKSSYPLVAEFAKDLHNTKLRQLCIDREDFSESYKFINQFNRIANVANNMHYLAYLVRKKLHEIKEATGKGGELPPVFLGCASAWRDIFAGEVQATDLHPYKIKTKETNAVTIGSLIENKQDLFLLAFENTDILKLKTCLHCFKIFLAEKRNRKFCSQTCQNRRKAKRQYQKKKDKN